MEPAIAIGAEEALVISMVSALVSLVPWLLSSLFSSSGQSRTYCSDYLAIEPNH
jgi:hypothetical protein